MIVGIDHLVLLCPEIEHGIAAYAALLGRAPDWRSVDPAGAVSALFQLEHVALEVLAPQGAGPMADRLRDLLSGHGPGLQTLVFASDDIEADHGTFRRRGLEPAAIQAASSIDQATGRARHWRSMRLGDAHCGGLRTFVLQRETDDPLVAVPAPAHALVDLDHLVVTTTAPGRALGHYGARLGIELTLDRSDAAQQSSLLVFKAGASGIEVAQRPSRNDASSAKEAVGEADSADRLWGITWRTRDIDGANARLRELGHAVSEVRIGRRRGTRVFTVRDRTLGVPTLVVAGEADALSAG